MAAHVEAQSRTAAPLLNWIVVPALLALGVALALAAVVAVAVAMAPLALVALVGLVATVAVFWSMLERR